jgi:hypothetical protein
LALFLLPLVLTGVWKVMVIESCGKLARKALAEFD